MKVIYPKRNLLLLRLFVAVVGLTLATLPAASEPPAAAPDGPSLAFSVISVKSNNNGSPLHIDSPQDGDGISITDISLNTFVMFAYNIQSRDLFAGLPDWANSEHYDIQAKVAEQDIAAYGKLTDKQRRQMLQAVLANSFQMKCHYESREMPTYALVVAKGGPKIKEVVPGAAHPNAPKGRDGTPMQGQMIYANRMGELAGQETSMSTFATSIAGTSMAGHQVIDKTGLTGVYDFTLNWTPVQSASRASSENDAPDTGPSFFTALQEQMGLRLEPQKTPLPFLVIDHIERPANQ